MPLSKHVRAHFGSCNVANEDCRRDRDCGIEQAGEMCAARRRKIRRIRGSERGDPVGIRMIIDRAADLLKTLDT
jgi:hypothetical protein